MQYHSSVRTGFWVEYLIIKLARSLSLSLSLYYFLNSQPLYFPHIELKLSKFKVCKSVHHRTIQINHQPDETIFQFIILMFIYSSTCFGRFPAYHQELNDCSGSFWFYLNKRQDNKLENCCI
jgi:hypothetical protein